MKLNKIFYKQFLTTFPRHLHGSLFGFLTVETANRIAPLLSLSRTTQLTSGLRDFRTGQREFRTSAESEQHGKQFGHHQPAVHGHESGSAADAGVAAAKILIKGKFNM